MKRRQRSTGMYACPKQNSSPLPEYSIELRFVAPIASATAATSALRCAHPAIDTITAMPTMTPPSIRIFSSLLTLYEDRRVEQFSYVSTAFRSCGTSHTAAHESEGSLVAALLSVFVSLCLLRE